MSLIDRLGLGALVAVAGVALILLVGPSLIVVAVSFEPRGFIAFPPSGVSLRWYRLVVDNQQLMDAALVSLRIAATVMVAGLLIGTPAAFALVRGRFRGMALANAFLLTPQMMPGMVLGIGSLFFGAYLGFRASDLMLVLSLGAFCLPFTVRIAMARLAGLNPELDSASANLGARPAETFLRITVPQLAPALLAAAAFTFIEAFDNVTVALFTSDVRARPLPVELYYLVQNDSTPAIAALSSLEIALSLAVILVLGRTVGLARLGR